MYLPSEAYQSNVIIHLKNRRKNKKKVKGHENCHNFKFKTFTHD